MVLWAIDGNEGMKQCQSQYLGFKRYGARIF